MSLPANFFMLSILIFAFYSSSSAGDACSAYGDNEDDCRSADCDFVNGTCVSGQGSGGGDEVSALHGALLMSRRQHSAPAAGAKWKAEVQLPGGTGTASRRRQDT